MAFESQRETIKVGGEHTFIFQPAASRKFVLGISGFSLKFANDGHHYVQRLKTSLGVNKGGENRITVTAWATLDDNHHGHIDPSSTIDVSVLAWNGDYPNLTMANKDGISSTRLDPDTQQVSQVGHQVLRQAVLAGFDFSYPDDDHALHQVTIAVGSNFNARAGMVTPTVTGTMTGHNSSVATCSGNCGLIVLRDQTVPAWLRATSFNLSGGESCPFVKTYTSCTSYQYVTFMTGFDIQYAAHEDHKLRMLQAGAKAASADGTTTASTYMADNDKNFAAVGRVFGVTIGYCDPPAR